MHTAQTVRYRCALTASLLALACTAAASADRHDMIVSSRFSSSVIRYHGDDGSFMNIHANGNGMVNAIGMDFGPDGNLYVASGDLPLVNKYDARTGAFLGAFVWDDPNTEGDETGGLSRPRGLTFGPDGNLYVSSGGGDEVLKYDGATGGFLQHFASHASLDGPIGLVFDDSGDLYVASALTDTVLKFNGQTGDFIKIVFTGLVIDNPTGVVFDTDGTLLVASGIRNQIVRLDVDACASLGVFASGGGLNVPIGVTFGPDGNLYVGSFNNDSVLRYDGQTGAFIDRFVSPGSGGLDGTHFILFLPPVADVAAVDVTTGSILSGGVGELIASDDASVHTRSGFGETFTDLHNMTMAISANTAAQNPTTIDLRVETRLDQPAGIMQLRLRDWSTGTFVLVDTQGINDAEQVYAVDGIDATRFVQPNSGSIDLQLKQIVFVPQFAFLFESWVDWVELSVQ